MMDGMQGDKTRWPTFRNDVTFFFCKKNKEVYIFFLFGA